MSKKKKIKEKFKQIDDYDQVNELDVTDRNIRHDSPIRDQMRIHVKRNSDLEIIPIHIKSTEQNDDGELTAKSENSNRGDIGPKRKNDHFRDHSTSNLLFNK